MGSEDWLCISCGKGNRAVVSQPASLTQSVIGPKEIYVSHRTLATISTNLPKGFQQNLTASHHQNWIRVIRTGSLVAEQIESAFLSDVLAQLALLCIRTGQPVRRDPKNETIVGLGKEDDQTLVARAGGLIDLA